MCASDCKLIKVESTNAFPLGLTIVLLRYMPSLRLPKPWREKVEVEATRRRTVITTPEHVPVNVLMLLPSLSVSPPRVNDIMQGGCCWRTMTGQAGEEWSGGQLEEVRSQTCRHPLNAWDRNLHKFGGGGFGAVMGPWVVESNEEFGQAMIGRDRRDIKTERYVSGMKTSNMALVFN